MSWESEERDRAVASLERLVRERNKLLRDRSALRAALRVAIGAMERVGLTVGPNMKLLAKARRP